MTWESIRDAYEDIAAGEYFWQVLRLALDSYDQLVAPDRADYGKHTDDRMTGRAIYDRFRANTLEFEFMGRNLWLQGDQLRQDVDSGRWRKHVYEVRRSGPAPIRNWFSVADFVALVNTLTDSGS